MGQRSTREPLPTAIGEDGGVRRSVLAGVVLANVSALVLVLWWTGHRTDRPGTAERIGADRTWDGLDPQARCSAAMTRVTQPDPWPTVCRWREPTDTLQGQSFPPPKGDPPFDDPHIEIYVDRSQTPDELAHAIAHEMGHMRHTREPTFVPAWLAARGLPADTPSTVWTEDYAEVFAALFSPPSDLWRAPTSRPTADTLGALRAQFFA
jgi:hypothetical protein